MAIFVTENKSVNLKYDFKLNRLMCNYESLDEETALKELFGC